MHLAGSSPSVGLCIRISVQEPYYVLCDAAEYRHAGMLRISDHAPASRFSRLLGNSGPNHVGNTKPTNRISENSLARTLAQSHSYEETVVSGLPASWQRQDIIITFD